MAIAYHTPRAIYLRCALRAGLWSGDTAPTQFSDPINFDQVEINTPVQETEALISNMIDSYGSALDSQNRPTDPANVNLEFSTLTPHLINLAIGATVAESTQSSATVTDESVDTALNIWVPLANEFLDSSTALTLKTSGDVSVDAAKFEVDYTAGMIKAIHADAVGSGMKATYDTAARTWEQYEAGNAVSSYVMLRGQALDLVTGETGILQIHKASLAAGGAFDPVAGGHLRGTLAGDMITPTGYTSPWRWSAVTA